MSLHHLLPVCSAVLLYMAFPPVEASWLGWIGLAPLLVALRRSSFRRAVLLAWLFGICFSVAVFFSLTAFFTPSHYLLFVLVVSLYVVLFGALYRIACCAGGVWPTLGAPAIWVGVEYLRSHLAFLAWPINLLGHSQYRSVPLIQVADMTGVYGVSFAMVMVSQVASELLEPIVSRRQPGEGDKTTLWGTRRGLADRALAIAGVLLLLLGYGWHRNQARPTEARVRVALVQANVLASGNMPLRAQMEHLGEYGVLTGEAAMEKPDLIVWPSSSLPGPMDGSRVVHFTIERLAHQTGAWLIVGGAGYDKVKPHKDRNVPYANSEYLITPAGQIAAQYHKMRLVPFNEYLPLDGVVSWPEWLTTVKESFRAGAQPTLFTVGAARFGTPICWENLLPDFYRHFVLEGANLMVSVANEGFLGRTAGPRQTLASNVFRAVENRVAVVRATTTGVSAFIEPNGEIVARVADAGGEDRFVAGFLVRDVPLCHDKTFYTRYGDVFAYAAIGLAMAVLARALWVRTHDPVARC